MTLSITSLAQRGLKLDWPEVSGASQYRIERDVDATDGNDSFTEVGQSSDPSISFTNLSLTEAMNHKYRVLACGVSGCDLAAGTAAVTGNLAGSIVSANQAVDDGSEGRVMATAKRDDATHVLAVGMPGFNGERGMVLIYERAHNSAQWSALPTTLVRSTGVTLDHFGASVALSPNGRWLAVGMPGDDAPTDEDGINPPLAGTAPGVDGSGGVHVYRYAANGSWTLVARIKAANARKDDAFGSSVAIGNDGQLIVGAPNEDGGSSGDVYLYGTADPAVFNDKTAEDRGAVYLYSVSGDLYRFQAYVKPPVPSGATSVFFGAAVAADQSALRVAVGAPRASFNGLFAGGVLIYDLNWLWAGAAKPAPLVTGFAPQANRDVSASPNPGPSSSAYRGFGGALSMASGGDWLAVGYPEKAYEPGDGGAARNAAGQVIVYRYQGTQWGEHSVLLAHAPKAADRFGISVSMVNANGPRLLVGVLEDDSDHIGLRRAADFPSEATGAGTPNAGAAYYFVENPDPTGSMLPKARLKAPRAVGNLQLGRATGIAQDGSELLLSGKYVDGANGSSAIFFGY